VLPDPGVAAATGIIRGVDSVAYIVLSHRNPGQVARLVDRLVRSDPTGHVVLAHDSGAGPVPLNDVAGRDRIHELPSSSPRGWGGFGLVSDLLEAIEWSLDHLDADWLAVLSGQDYPLRPLAGYGDDLAASGFDVFATGRAIALTRPARSDSAGLYMHARYYYRWFRLPRWVLGWMPGRRLNTWVSGALRRFSAGQPWVFVWRLPRSAGDVIGVRRRHLPFDDRFPCYVGSQWLTMSRRAAEELRGFVRSRPDVMSLYRESIISDESLIVTILFNSPRLLMSPSNHHRIRMTGPGESHASVLTVEDLADLSGSGQWFARKFDPAVDREVLDRLDDRILPSPG
jgi:hypothetical protein